MRPGRRAGALGLAALLFATPAAPWGQTGHRVVGEIAQRHLSAAARADVERILSGETLAMVANWADSIRSLPEWNCAGPFHYVTVPPGKSYPDGAGSGGDVVESIVWYSQVLRPDSRSLGRPATAREQREALSFLVHFVGDVHQPLHVGLGCDRGGNDVSVEWFGESRPLHAVWDSGLVDRQELSYTELADFVLRRVDDDREAIAATPVVDWLDEAQELLPAVYSCFTRAGGDRCPCFQGDCPDGLSRFGGCPIPPATSPLGSWPGPPRLGWEYRHHRMPVVERQLLRAGLRLAALLDWVLTGAEAPESFQELERRIASDPEWSAPYQVCVGPP